MTFEQRARMTRKWQREQLREYEKMRAREQILPRIIFLAFILGVLALGMSHISTRL